MTENEAKIKEVLTSRIKLAGFDVDEVVMWVECGGGRYLPGLIPFGNVDAYTAIDLPIKVITKTKGEKRSYRVSRDLLIAGTPKLNTIIRQALTANDIKIIECENTDYLFS